MVNDKHINDEQYDDEKYQIKEFRDNINAWIEGSLNYCKSKF